MGEVRTFPLTATTAGTINIAAAPGAGKRLALHGFLLTQSSAGTIKFVGDGGGTPVELCGAMSVLGSSPLNVRRLTKPLYCAENKTLDLVSTGGNSAGVVFYSVEDV